MPGVDVLASAFNGANAAYIADAYARWATDPSSVDPSFQELFAALNDEAHGVMQDAAGPSWAPRAYSVADDSPKPSPAKAETPAAGEFTAEQVRAAAMDSLRASC